MRSKRENPSKKHEDYHFAKSKQATPFVFNTTPYNKKLTPAELLLLSSTLYYMVRLTNTPATTRPLSPPHSRELKSACYANATQAIKTPTSPIEPSNPTPAIFFHGHPVKDVTNKLTRCEKKLEGSSTGKICYFNNKKHMLKKVTEDGLIFSGTDYLLSVYCHTLLKDYIRIRVPNMGYFYEKEGKISQFSYNLFENEIDGEFYLGTEFIDGFIQHGDIYNNIRRTMFPRENIFTYTYNSVYSGDAIGHAMSYTLRKKLNENSIAKLLVASTLIDDLLLNPGNWGLANNKLVIVDMDSFGSIGDPEGAMISISNSLIHMSGNTITLMREIYKTMLAKPAPTVNRKVDLSQSDYENLIQTYLTACTNTLDDIINYDIDPTIPSRTINHFFCDNIHELSSKNKISNHRL